MSIDLQDIAYRITSNTPQDAAIMTATADLEEQPSDSSRTSDNPPSESFTRGAQPNAHKSTAFH